MARVHVIIPTHTTRHLEPVLAALAQQTEPAASVVVSCDTDDPALGGIVAAWAERMPHDRVLWVSRPSMGRNGVCQARNNAVRALDAADALHDDDQLVFIDGDISLEPEAVAKHRAVRERGADVALGFRLPLTEDQTERYLAGETVEAIEPSPRELAKLAQRDRRYRRHIAVAGLPLSTLVQKPLKPKVIGCHHAVSVETYRRVNGYDEEYTFRTSEDDDLSLRLNYLRPRPRFVSVVKSIRAVHLYHPETTPKDKTADEGYQRLMRVMRTKNARAERGLRRPLDQPEPRVVRLK
ncbi:MAG: glycosyltransferase [Planctomycetota bacterium]